MTSSGESMMVNADELTRRADVRELEPQTPLTKLESKNSVLARITLSNSELYRRIRAGSFPAPVKLSADGRRIAFVRAEVDHWIAERIAQPRAITHK